MMHLFSFNQQLKRALGFLLLGFSLSLSAQESDSTVIAQIFEEALMRGNVHQDLRDLCKKAGPRLSGSEGARKAVKLTADKMKGYGFDSVYRQEVYVPHWERGEEDSLKVKLFKLRKRVRPMPICALGGSIGGSVEGEVVEVLGWNELRQMKREDIEGKIIFFNRPMDARMVYTFGAYGTCVDQRVFGAIWAGHMGAKGILVRSMNLSIDDYPHTGSMAYADSVFKIPAAAISTQGAEELSQLLKNDSKLKVAYTLRCKNYPEALSHNVVGQVNGKRYKHKFIAVGGHLDSWDLGEGAHDDGAGCMQSIEVLRLLKAVGYEPNYSLRSVMWMNEENGLRGAIRYAEIIDSLGEKHVAALEADRGAFAPRGFFIQADAKYVERIKEWQYLFEPYGVHLFKTGGAGADVGPIQRKDEQTVLIGFVPDSQRYFDYHHAATDVFESVNKREIELGAAALASLVYLLDKYEIGE